MPLGRTPITWNMTVRDALLNVINEDMEELFSRVEALESGKLAGLVLATEEEAIAGVDNSKAMTPLRTHQAIAAHISLGVDADTLDGYDSTGFHKKDESIYLSQGQIVDFADEAGDKIRLHGTQYGVAINPNELTLYKPSTSEIAVRDSAYNGQKLGNVIHTGNIDASGVARKISTIASTPGNVRIGKIRMKDGYTYYLPTSYTHLFEIFIPWSGVTSYSLNVTNNYSGGVAVTVEIHTSEYGPYAVGPYNSLDIIIDAPGTGIVDIYAKCNVNTAASIKELTLETGNTDVLQWWSLKALNNYYQISIF